MDIFLNNLTNLNTQLKKHPDVKSVYRQAVKTERQPFCFVSIMLFLLLSFILCSCSITTQANLSVVNTTEEDDGITQLYLDIVFSSGLFASKYDADVFINGENIGTITYGERFTKLVNVDPDEYTIQFRSTNNKEIASPELKVNVEDDTTLSCTLKSEKDKIKVNNQKLSSGLIGAHLETPDLSYSLLNEAEKRLETIGFVNISYQSDNGKSIIDHSNWLVISQNVPAGTKIDKNDPVILICQKKEALIDEWFSGTTILSAEPVAEKYGYSLQFINKVSYDDLKAESFSDDEKALWKVSEIRDASGKTAKLTVQYSGLVTMPNVVGQILSNAIKELKLLNYSSIEEKSDTGIIWDDDNWFVIEQGIPANQSIAADTTVILYCSKDAAQSRSVFNIPTPLEKISLPNNYSSVVLGDSFSVAYELYPQDATDVDLKYEYDSEYLSLSGSSFTALKPGNTMIRLKQSDSIFADFSVEILYIDVENIAIEESISLNIGSSYVPKVTFFPDNASSKTYVLQSDNPDIVSITGDTITGITEGQATVIATSENGKTASLSVDVVPIPLRSMVFKNRDVSLLIGNTEKLDVDFSPADVTYNELEWSSSNDKVVTVDENGVITGNSVGSAVITATHIASGMKIEREISVLPITVKSVSITAASSTMTVGETLQLKSTVSPENATNRSVNWSSSNNAVATVSDNGTVKAVGVGNVTITCASPDGPNSSYILTIKGQSVTLKASFSAACSNYNHVGNDWSQTYYIKNSPISSNYSSFTAAIGDVVDFGAQIIEHDSREDVGYDSISVTITNEMLTQGFTKTFTVTVYEGSGRYSGYAAQWNVTVRISR